MLEIESLPSFPTPSLKDWEDKIKRELKITHLEELDWITPEGIALKPLYQKSLHAPDSATSTKKSVSPVSPFTAWECLFLGENSPWRRQIREAITWGISHFWIPAASAIPLDEVRAYIDSVKEKPVFLLSAPQQESIPEAKNRLLPEGIEFSYAPVELGRSLATSNKGWDLRNMYEAGGNLAHQLAVTLASFVRVYTKLDSDAFHSYLNTLTLHVSVGTSFYREIAKFRVLPLLIQRLMEEWDLGEVPPPAVMAHSTHRDLGKNDPAMNAVRHSLACLAARLGGCQHICLHPLQENPDIFQLRLARNIPILLLKEGKLQHVEDPVAGASFLEELGVALGEKAWEHFLAIETRGGLENAWQEGLIQEWMDTGKQGEKELLQQGKKVRIGENKYRYEGN